MAISFLNLMIDISAIKLDLQLVDDDITLNRHCHKSGLSFLTDHLLLPTSKHFYGDQTHR